MLDPRFSSPAYLGFDDVGVSSTFPSFSTIITSSFGEDPMSAWVDLYDGLSTKIETEERYAPWLELLRNDRILDEDDVRG